VEVVVGELRSALDALVAEDLGGLVAPQLLDRTALLVAARNILDAELARTVRRAECAQAAEHDGLKSMRSWLCGHARLSPAAAGQLVRNGRVLEQLPAVAAACAEGVVTGDQVSVLAPVTRPENLTAAAEQGIDLGEVDRLLAQTAATQRHEILGQVVQHYLSRLDPDGAEPDPTDTRSLSIARHPDGSRTFRGELDAVGGEKLETWLEALLQANRPAGDTRSRAQQLADALVQGVDNALAAGQAPILRTVKPHVIVKVGIEDLVDPAAGPGAATTGFGATISAARARMLACDGNVTRIVFGPDSRPTDLGRDKRCYPPHLRRAIEVRDEHCVFAGCHAPTYWCDVHHLVHWADDGETSEDNGALLCERHHTKVHHGFTIVRDPDGRWHTYRPDGTEILIPTPLRV
jgi:hypothetical protein